MNKSQRVIPFFYIFVLQKPAFENKSVQINQIQEKTMKSINFRILTVMLLAAALFSSCGLNRMVRNYDEGVRYTPATNPLEAHGGEVAAEVRGNISEGYFHRRAVMELTPVLVHEAGEEVLPTVTLRGSRTTTDGQMVNRDRAYGFDMNNVIDYRPEMAESELIIRARLYREGRADRATELPARKVADGVIATGERVDMTALETSIAPHGYEKETIITQKANLYFEYMRHNLNLRLPLNREDEAQQKRQELEEFLTRGWEIRSIEVNAWASPEGEVAFNERLSENRASTGERFLRDMIRRLEREKRMEIERPSLQVQAKGEDFDGFMQKLNASDLPDKQAIANVINSQLAPAERERRIKDMTVIYAEIEKILQPLRRAEFVVQAYEPKKTDEEIATLSTTDPSQLDVKELLYAATLTDDLNTRLTIYRSAQQLHPRDYRGFNNAGAVMIEMGNFDGAATDLERANQLEPNNGHVQNNLGILAAIEGDYDNARSLFEAARAQGIDVSYNMGALMVVKGDYQAAASSFAGRTCTYNVAMSQLMAGNEQAAINTLNCAPESAQVHYLKAIIGARRNDTSMMYDGLRRAIAMEPEYKEIASKDREFIQYHNRSEFQEIVR
jgi:tetratricopeptide (TPR) repeat protein